MTARAKHSTPATTSPAPVVLFGIDSHGKPKAARFGKEYASLAIKAANQLQLAVLAGDDPKVAEIVARLPVCRVHATGRTFVPFIRRDLYDKLVAAARTETAIQQARPPAGVPALRDPERLAARRPTCLGIGKRSVLAIWLSPRRVWRTAGTRPSSSKPLATCSRCAGVTTRENDGSCAIGFGSDCSIRKAE